MALGPVVMGRCEIRMLDIELPYDVSFRYKRIHGLDWSFESTVVERESRLRLLPAMATCGGISACVRLPGAQFVRRLVPSNTAVSRPSAASRLFENLIGLPERQSPFS